MWTAGVLCGGGLCDADQNWRGPFLGCRGWQGWAGSAGGPKLTGACASVLVREAVPPRCQLSDELTVRARVCTNKAWQTVGGGAGVQLVVHTRDRRSL